MLDNNINAVVGVAGKFYLTLTNQKTGEVREYSFNNLILDSGLNKYGSATSYSDFIDCAIVGSSTDEPVATQTTMSGVMAVTTTKQASGQVAINTTTVPYWQKSYATYRFAAGVATGNISQIAVGWGGSPSTSNYQGLFSLVRIKDSGGNPITITKLSDEVLDVRYELQLILPSVDSTGTVSIGGQTYNYIARPAQAANWDAFYPIRAGSTPSAGTVYTGDIGTQLSFPSGTTASAETTFFNSNPAGVFSCTGGLICGLNFGNLSGGIRSIRLNFYGHNWQIQYNNTVDNSKIPKDATKTMRLNFTLTFARATPI